jgi:hypothetical protein
MPEKPVRARRQRAIADKNTGEGWIEGEFGDTTFADERLGRRFRTLLEQLSSSPGDAIPMVCQDWANTKAAYRFLDNDRVNEAEILAGHFQSTRERATATSGPVLILHDTTEVTYKREKSEAIGKTRINIAGAYRDGTPRFYTACGILMHSSLAVTTDGLPLGLTSIKFWSREKFKGTSRLKRHINPTRVPIEEKESIRWLENLAQSTRLLGEPEHCVHIGDRESDIYELFCKAQDLGTQFLFRTCVDRLAGDGTVTVSAQMEEVLCKGVHRVAVRDQRGNVTEAVLELRYQKIHVLAPLYKQGRYPPLDLTVLHATERGKPKGRDPIDWKLITNLPVTSRAQAIEKLQWYALRWKIEVFHKILKSGCQAEQSKLRTAERLVNLLAMLCILSWRIFWLTMINRVAPDAKASLAFTGLEIQLLQKLIPSEKDSQKCWPPPLHSCLLQLARLGGYLNRKSDAPPGNTVIWRGMARLTDIEIGFQLGAQLVGN